MNTASDKAALEISAARAVGDWPTVRRLAEQFIAHETAPSPATFLTLAQACWHLKMLEPADRAAQSAIAADPTLVDAIIIAAWVAVAREDGENAVKYYRRLAELNPDTPRWQLKLVKLLNGHGRIDEAVRELDRLCQRWPDDRNVRTYLKLFEPESPLGRVLAEVPGQRGKAKNDVIEALEKRAPTAAEWRRPLLVPEPQLDLQVAPVMGAHTAVLVFAGGDDGVSIPLSIFDRYMATLEATTIYLRDFRRLLYLGGIQSLSENYHGTLGALRNLLDGLGMKHLAVIGNCNGAAAAIRYGIELDAKRILASSPITHFPTGLKYREGLILKAKRLTNTVDPELMDLKPFLEGRPHSGQIEICYKDEDEFQNEQVLRISHIPGVRLHPLEGHPRDDPLLRLALSTENFAEKLAAWLEVEPISRIGAAGK